MELVYQGLRIRLPLDGAVRVESFVMVAALNEHAWVELEILMAEEDVVPAVCGISDGDGIEVYGNREELLFAGKVMDARMLLKRGLRFLYIKAASYTVDWNFAPVSQSFLNLDATYRQVMEKVLANQPGAEIKDCVTGGAKIQDFLLQYEESDWEFLVRLASHFGTFLVPDCRAGHGRAYFGIPDLGEEHVLNGAEYREIKDLDRHGRTGGAAGMPFQEGMEWEAVSGEDIPLAAGIRFCGISTVVTRIRYEAVDGGLVRSYGLRRRKGLLCRRLVNLHICGMSIPATVKERSGSCVRVHFHIDPVHDTSPNARYFAYALESSLLHCMPEVGSCVHIYFPSAEEKDAMAVHAVRMGGAASSGYAQNPDTKSFTNKNGAESFLGKTEAGISADGKKQTSVILDIAGNVSVKGTNIVIGGGKYVSVGYPVGPGGSYTKDIVMEAGSLLFLIGKEGPGILLTEEARAFAEFLRFEASDRSLADPCADYILNQLTEGDIQARAEINGGAAAQLVQKYEEGRALIVEGLGRGLFTVVTVAVAVVGIVSTGGLASPAIIGAATTVLIGTTEMAFAASDTAEGIDCVAGSRTGSLDMGFNPLRDGLGWSAESYYFWNQASQIAFGVVSSWTIGKEFNILGKMYDPIAFPCESQKLKNLKTAIQIGGNVFNGMVNNLATKGKIDPFGLMADMAIGMLQGQLGTSVRDEILGIFGLGDSRLATAIAGTVVDTVIDWGMSDLLGQDFDLLGSLGRNSAANIFAAFVPDPVDAVTGAYIINTTDFILASLPTAMKVGRRYCSISGKDSVFGRGWSFPYASRIYRDTGDMVQPRIHLEAVTGHSLCFEKQGDRWISQCRGTGRFSMEVRDGEGFPEKETFLLTDVVEHTLSAYDRQGRLSYVEYPNGIRTVLAYGEEGLEQIVTPVGNVLEVVCEEGHILQITDEIGRRTQYKYKDGCLTDVVHTDEGITHYEYDEGGRIKSVTDQNGSRYLENEYDEKGRIVRQCFTSGVYQTFAYDDAHRRNTVYFSESGKREVYEYNDQLLVERTVYDDSTATTCIYSDDNMKTSETSRQGHRKEWEYDGFGRVVLEKFPDGYQVCHEYDGNHDMVRTWDTDGCESLLTYDSAHNLILLREKISEGRWRETSKAYDSMGRCIREKDALGNETVKEYGLNTVYPVRIVTPKGEETDYGYDIVGRRMSISNAYGTVELAYNSRNFVTRRTDGEGYTSHRFYDRMGKLTAYYPPVQWERKEGAHEYRYDFMERLVDTITPLQEHRRVFRNFDGKIINKVHPVSYALHGEGGEGTRYEYDSNGNCIRTIHPDGGVERRFYDADGNMVKQVLPESYDAVADDGAGYRYVYDSCGRLVMVQDSEENTLHIYEYNGHSQVVREVDGEGKETLYAYNGIGLKTREQTSIRKDGDTAYYRVICYAYDSQGNKVEEAYGQQEVIEGGEPESWHRIVFSYDQNNRLVVVEDGYGAQVRYDYDCLGNVVLEEKVVEEGIRSTVRYAYNRNGWRIQKTEEIQGNGEVKSATTRYGYDANGSLVKQTTPKGCEISWRYDADGRLVEERATDRRNGIDRRVQYAYDEAGRILKRTVLGADGERLESGFGYDLKNRLTCRTNPGGAAARYLYDWNDRILKEIGAYCTETEGSEGMGTAYAYDSRGNRTRIVNALGETVQELSYNLNNQVEEWKDAYGNWTGFIYGLDGQLAEVRRESGRMEGDAADHGPAPAQRVLQQYEYGANGQITGIIDGNQDRKEYGRDSWGRITAVRYADGTEERYWYTPTGKIGRTADGNGNIVQYRYNSLGKVRERIDQLGYKETFQYDEEGNLALHVDRDGRRLQRRCNIFGRPVYEKAVDAEGKNPCISTWYYDSIGRVVRAMSNGHSYEYVYDACGNLKEKRSSGRCLVSYAYDRVGQIKEIRDPAGVCTCYEYDIIGRRSRIHNGTGLDVQYGYDALNRIRNIRYGNGVETSYAYDGDGNVSHLETKVGGDILFSFMYQYDGNGNRTTKIGRQMRAAAPGCMTEGSSALDISYQYDARGQLLEERRNGASVCYAYDRAGNRIWKGDVSGETAYHYNEKNQMLSAEGKDGRKCFTYDRQGGILKEEDSSGVRNFAYDSRHRQTRIEERRFVKNGAGKVQENRYDVENLRFELLEDGRRTSFVYHNGVLLHEERRGEGHTSFCLNTGIDAFQRGQEVYYIHQDEQLGTALVTDTEGDLTNSYWYDAFGNGLESLEQVPNRICYTGQQLDGLTGQYYLRARYYNPAFGQFMQEDVYQGDGLNLYVYCGNNPVVYYDSSGYSATDIKNSDDCPPEGYFGGDGDEENANQSKRLVNINDCTAEDLSDPNVIIYGTYGELSNNGIIDSHHLLQNAAMRDVEGYDSGEAPAIQASGPSTLIGSEHYNLTYAQSHAEKAGTYGIEKEIGMNAATKEFDLDDSNKSILSEFIDRYFKGKLHLDENSPTRVPGNRHHLK